MNNDKSTQIKAKTRRRAISIWSFLKSIFYKSTEDEIDIQAAALSYYAVFSVFPLLILIGNIVGLMDLNIENMIGHLSTVVPGDVLNLLEGYLSYTKETASPILLTFSIVFSVYFPFRAVRQLMNTIRKAYDLPRRKSRISSLIRELGCTLLIPLSLIICLMLIIFGQNVLMELNQLLFKDLVPVSNFVIESWQYIRFVIAGIVFAITLTVLYEVSLDKPVPLKRLLPGITLVIAVWLTACVLFSFYVENFAHYSVIYGTLGGFIVLLLWLYFTSSIFIAGAQFNAVRFQRHHS